MVHHKTIALVTLSPNSHRTAEENLGIGYLASALRKNNYSVVIIDGWLEGLTKKEVLEKICGDPHIYIVGVSCYMSNNDDSIKLAKSIRKKRPDIKLICGGFGPSFHPEKFVGKEAFDVAMIGEGEESIIEVCDALFYNKALYHINNIVFFEHNVVYKTQKGTQILNLDSLAFPARDTMMISFHRKSTINVLTSRGCKGNCLFCSVNAFWKLTKGKKWRGRSITNIVDELEQLYQLGIRHVKFVDDSFIDGNRDALWAKEFYLELQRRNIRMNFRGSIRADLVTDELIKYLKKAGFSSFACGIENGSSTALKRMNKSAILESNHKALDIFKKYHILVQAGYILFDDKTTFEEIKENYVFLKKHDEIVMKGIFSEMFAASGTLFTQKLERENKIKQIEIYENYRYEIVDEKVRLLYLFFKRWHKNHMEIYDKIVDPISTPKAISNLEAQEFYDIYLQIKRVDMSFMKMMIDFVESGMTQEEIETAFIIYENQTEPVYMKANIEADKIYARIGLTYDAKANPFIS